ARNLSLLVFNAAWAGGSWHVWLLGCGAGDSRREAWQDRRLSIGSAILCRSCDKPTGRHFRRSAKIASPHPAKASTRWCLSSPAASLDELPGICDLISARLGRAWARGRP